jgi:hypothetical protein
MRRPQGCIAGRLARDPGVFFGKLLFLDVLPASVRIVAAQTHHKIARMLGDEKLLQQEAAGADL